MADPKDHNNDKDINDANDLKNLTYEQAVTELDTILRTIQSDKCDIDKLTTMTKRATKLLSFCRQKLTTTETELREILASLQEG